MLVDVTIAGCTVAWSFPGAPAFATWLEGKPWLKEGGTCILRTGTRTFDDLLTVQLEGCIRAANGDAGRLDVHKVECGVLFGTPYQALLNLLEIEPSLGSFEAREPLKNRLRHNSAVFIFSEIEYVDAQIWAQFIFLLEHYRKADPLLRITTVILDSRGVVPGSPVFDYTSGRATHQVLSEAAEIEDAVLWPLYLHQRICWEAGGNFEYARILDAEVFRLSSGDDEGFEVALNSVSTERLRSEIDIDMVNTYLGADRAATLRAPKHIAAVQTKLLEQRALWRPPGMRTLKLVPWLSRAILLGRGAEAASILALRHNLVCAPLAGEVLSLCLTIESGIRVQLFGRGDSQRLKAKTVDAHDNFKAGNDMHIVYPIKHPSPPQNDADVWAFASFGELLMSCPPSAVSDSFWRILKLRNGIAHGHYVAWAQVRLAAQQLRRFDARV